MALEGVEEWTQARAVHLRPEVLLATFPALGCWIVTRDRMDMSGDQIAGAC